MIRPINFLIFELIKGLMKIKEIKIFNLAFPFQNQLVLISLSLLINLLPLSIQHFLKSSCQIYQANQVLIASFDLH